MMFASIDQLLLIPHWGRHFSYSVVGHKSPPPSLRVFLSDFPYCHLTHGHFFHSTLSFPSGEENFHIDTFPSLIPLSSGLVTCFRLSLSLSGQLATFQIQQSTARGVTTHSIPGNFFHLQPKLAIFLRKATFSFFNSRFLILPSGEKTFSTFNTHFFASFSCLRNSKREIGRAHV